MPRIDRRRQAFTLIELLVVVAIISLLISILLPSLGQARRSAQKAVCMANMRQVVIGVRGYLNDNNDCYPATMAVGPSGLPEPIGWFNTTQYQAALGEYISEHQGGVDHDGRARDRRSVWFDPADPDAGQPAMWGSFLDNGLITGVPRRDGEIKRPGATIFQTLRHADWAIVTESPVPNPLPADNPNHPFWSGGYFDLCADPWLGEPDESSPYHWSTGRAIPPGSLILSEGITGPWDEVIDGRSPLVPGAEPRYGDGQPYSYCDGSVRFRRFEDTYAFPEQNEWDVE